LNPRVMKYSRQSLTDALRANVFLKGKKG